MEGMRSIGVDTSATATDMSDHEMQMSVFYTCAVRDLHE